MKASKLKEVLEHRIDLFGDVPVRFMSDTPNTYDDAGDSVPVGGVTAILDENEKAGYLLVGDEQSLREMQQ